MANGDEILRALLALQGDGGKYITDKAIAGRLQLPLGEVRGWLELLHEGDRVWLSKTLEAHKALLSDKHKVLLNQEAEPEGAEREDASDPRKVFVVHGRNEKARDEVFAFLHAIDLHPLDWDELLNATNTATPYVGDVLDKGFSEAHAAVVVMTPEDEARLLTHLQTDGDDSHERELTCQPRQNVLFEAGMAFGKYPEKTLILKFGTMRRMSDLEGRHVIDVKDEAQTRHRIARRLEKAGCAVNTTGTAWLDAGDFRSVLKEIEDAEVEQRPDHDRVRASDDHKGIDFHDGTIAKGFLQLFPPKRVEELREQVAIWHRVTCSTGQLGCDVLRLGGVEMRFLDPQAAEKLASFALELDRLTARIAMFFEREKPDSEIRIHEQPSSPHAYEEFHRQREDFWSSANRVKEAYEQLVMLLKQRWPEMVAREFLPDMGT